MTREYATVPGTKIKDHSGLRYNSWTILRYDHTRKRVHFWWARCKCGVEKLVMIHHVTAGRSRQCQACAARIDDRTGTAEYRIYLQMRKRCDSPKCDGYENYGGRGITVCKRWADDFAAFLQDMGPRPSTSHSIDRIDNNGHYEPSNCRWATPTEQMRNSRINHVITFRGTTMCISAWSQKTGLSASTIARRLSRGWTTSKALTTPPRKRTTREPITFRGATQSISAWARQIGMSQATLRNRLTRLGWPIERALTTPVAKTGNGARTQQSHPPLELGKPRCRHS